MQALYRAYLEEDYTWKEMAFLWLSDLVKGLEISSFTSFAK